MKCRWQTERHNSCSCSRQIQERIRKIEWVFKLKNVCSKSPQIYLELYEVLSRSAKWKISCVQCTFGIKYNACKSKQVFYIEFVRFINAINCDSEFGWFIELFIILFCNIFSAIMFVLCLKNESNTFKSYWILETFLICFTH